MGEGFAKLVSRRCHPLLSVRRNPTSSNLPAALALYKRVLRTDHDPSGRSRQSVPEILKGEKISTRTGFWKRPIAELQILDADKFETVINRYLMSDGGDEDLTQPGVLWEGLRPIVDCWKLKEKLNSR